MAADFGSSHLKDLEKIAVIYKDLEEFATENYFSRFLVLQLEIY